MLSGVCSDSSRGACPLPGDLQFYRLTSTHLWVVNGYSLVVLRFCMQRVINEHVQGGVQYEPLSND